MHKSPLLLACLTAFGACVHAGVPEGVEAHTKMRYTDARKELAEPAEQGDAEAMVLMGEMLVRGLGGARDELKARDYILKAKEAGSVRATYTLGQMYLSGNLVNKDETQGVALVKQAADLRYAPAQATLGSWISGGQFGMAKDEAIALAWFQAAVAQDNAQAMGWLGSYYESGKGGLSVDKLVALDWYKKSGDRGYAFALEAAGRMYALGAGVSPDGPEALRWFKRAVASGFVSSYNWIASVYEFGRGGVAKSPTLAYAWYAAVPANASASTLKTAAEGKERVQKLLSPAELEEASKQSKTVVSQTIVAEIGARPGGLAGAAPATRKGIYGSGVVVSRIGDIVTNEHVVRDCQKVRIHPLGSDVKVVAKDARNDLALLRVEGTGVPAAKFRSGKGLRMGDELVVVGYPLRGILSSGAVVTTGIVNALSGISDDTSAFQMSATVQPGSSGGPIFDHSGQLVGIVRARLLPSGPIAAQNVNFGINLPTLSNFLDAYSVDYAVNTAPGKTMSLVDITAMAQKSTVQVECY
ncbi:MAG: tetratricopeptide repeat-containing serine protease family protein [Pseudomonadota bacterium]